MCWTTSKCWIGRARSVQGLVGQVDQIGLVTVDRHDPCAPTLGVGDAFQKVGRLFIGDYDHDGLCSRSCCQPVHGHCQVRGAPEGILPSQEGGYYITAALSCGLFTHMSHEVPRFEGWRAHDKEAGRDMLERPQRKTEAARLVAQCAQCSTPSPPIHLGSSTSRYRLRDLAASSAMAPARVSADRDQKRCGTPEAGHRGVARQHRGDRHALLVGVS